MYLRLYVIGHWEGTQTRSGRSLNFQKVGWVIRTQSSSSSRACEQLVKGEKARRGEWVDL
jgi:hypothetical protein